MVVSIRACVFVPESDNMSQLVYYDTELVAVFPNGYCLRAITSSSNERTATDTKFRYIKATTNAILTTVHLIHSYVFILGVKIIYPSTNLKTTTG